MATQVLLMFSTDRFLKNLTISYVFIFSNYQQFQLYRKSKEKSTPTLKVPVPVQKLARRIVVPV
jgi:hypothetical protein